MVYVPNFSGVKSIPKSESGQLGRWMLLAGLWFVYASFGLVTASLAPLVGPIEAELGMTHAAMGSLMGAWQLVYIFSAVPSGMLLDRIGVRYALLIGVLLIAASAIGRALAVDYWSFLLAVMVFGLGGPIISAGAPKLVSELFAGSRRGLAMGIYMTGPAMGGVIALALTNSWLLPSFDGNWRPVMLVWGAGAAVVGVIWFVLARLFLREPPANGLNRPQFEVMRELIRARPVQIVLVMSVGVFLFNHGLNNWLVELLRDHGMKPDVAGYWATLPTLVGIIGSLVIPRLATPERRFPILLVLCLLAVSASVLLHFGEDVPLTVGLIVQGVARSSLMTVLILTLVELPGIGDRYAGVASGMFFAAAEVGGVLGPLGIGALYDATGNFTAALNGLTGVALLLCLGSMYLKRVAQK
jgi:MFS transporter, CP family, cyanate transporter